MWAPGISLAVAESTGCVRPIYSADHTRVVRHVSEVLVWWKSLQWCPGGAKSGGGLYDGMVGEVLVGIDN